MECPECNQEMIWAGDQIFEEDHILQAIYNCSECKIDILKSKSII